MSKNGKATSCAEKGVWTPAPGAAAPQSTSLSLKTIDPDEDKSISSAGKMCFHMTGCSGNYGDASNTQAVAAAIIARGHSSFLYHLGDITYTGSDKTDDDQYTMYNDQFLAPYTKYPKRIVAIPGNHDGKDSKTAETSAVQNFLANFCADPKKWPGKWAQNTTDSRPAMIQPNPYWRLDTPLAYFIGLNANISNAGILDDPSANKDYTQGPQYKWLVAQLSDVKQKNKTNSPVRAVLVTVHYPPYSGATDFNVRGDPEQGETPHRKNAPFLAKALQQAFSDSGQRADVLFSAHAHLFQRLTYIYADKSVMPCLIVGCGGHSLEKLFSKCDGSEGAKQKLPFHAVMPGSYTLPKGDAAEVEAYEDAHKGDSYGFIEVTIEKRVLKCTFYNTAGAPGHTFSLDLDKHQYL